MTKLAFRRWNRAVVKYERWHHFAIRPSSDEHGRNFMIWLRTWYPEQCVGGCMYHVWQHAKYIAVAFAEERDATLFVLTFSGEVSLEALPQYK